jgi:hypothetical protein
MATEGTKFQINYKLNDGTLVNLYASSVKELETGLADLAMNATNIKATGIDLSSALVAGAPAPTVESVAAAFAATPVQQYVPQTAPVVPPNVGNQCRHGEMAFRSGTSAKGPWKGYMCAAPKGAVDKCDTIWIR